MTELNYSLPQLLKALIDQGGSDLHISSGSPPRMRIAGNLLRLEVPELLPSQTQALCYSILTSEQKKEFEKSHEIDLSFNVSGLARFRANIFLQRGSVSGAFRAIPFHIKSIADLGLPPIIKHLTERPHGLILVTGPTGNGKSTTMAAMVNHLNQNFHHHIITIEDPIEFVHQHQNCIIDQREIGTDTHAFAKALRSAFRQDPDVILIGELRDLETISLAMTAAETGHLVLATLHTSSAVSTLTRVIDVFPSSQQSQITTQLSFSLIGVVSQLLIPTIDNRRALAMEVMIPNVGIRNMIRENKLHGIYSAMQSGQDETGMQTMNQSLLHLVQQRRITPDMALSKSGEVNEMENLLRKALSHPVKSKHK